MGSTDVVHRAELRRSLARRRRRDGVRRARRARARTSRRRRHGLPHQRHSGWDRVCDPWRLDDGSPAPSLADAEEVEDEPEQSTSEVDRPQFTWPVEPPSEASLLPLVAAPEPHSEAPVNLTGSAELPSPVNPTDGAETASPVSLTGSTTKAAEDHTEYRQA